MSTVDVEALRSSVDLVEYVSRYIQLTKSGAEYRGLCIFHDDHSPSFTVHPGKQIWACFSCCQHQEFGADVFGFIRSYERCTFPEAIAKLQNGSGGNGGHPIRYEALKKPPPRRTFPDPSGGKPNLVHRDFGEPVNTWVIKLKDGTPYFWEARYMVRRTAVDPDTGETVTREEKETRFFTFGAYADEPPTWECRHPANPRPFYGLEFLSERQTAQVMIHEAPKKAEAARALFPKQVHLAMVGGAHQTANTDVSVVKGRRCILLPDNDPAGREAMNRLALRLWDAGVVEVKGIDPETLPDGSLAPDGWDIADAQGWTPASALEWAKARKTDYAAPGGGSQPVDTSTERSRGRAHAVPSEEPILAVPAAAPPNAAPDASQAPSPPSEAPALGAAPSQNAVGTLPDAPDSPAPKPSDKPKRRKPALATLDGTPVPEGNAIRQPWHGIEPEVDQLPAFSEFALARRFVDTQGEDWRYVSLWHLWMRWNGQRWVTDERESITYAMMQCCKAALAEHGLTATPSQRVKLAAYKTVNATLALTRAQPELATSPSSWDTDPLLLGTPEGVIDLRTGELLPASREQLVSRAVAVVPAEGPHPLFDRVIARAAAEKPDMAAFLWRWLGYMLTGDTREERFIFLHGAGGSGKSTLIKVLADVLGEYARTIDVRAITEHNHERHSQEIAKLQGARLVCASETEEGSRFDESMLKWLTGRDKVTAHKMRQDDIEFYPNFKLLIYGNNRPSLKSVGEEMRRRIDLVEFPGTIPEAERDLTLKDRLREEYPAILHSMLRGCRDWQAQGLGRPESVTSATEKYLKANDALAEFIEDCLDVETDAETPSGDAYRAFKRFCEGRGDKHVMRQVNFSQRMEARGFALGKSRGERVIQGFRVKQDREYPDSSRESSRDWMPD